MSYDIFFVRRDPGQTFEDALDELEGSFEDGDIGELTDNDLEQWDALVPLAREILGEVEIAEADEATRELTARATGIELTLISGEIEIHVPAAGRDVDELELMSTVYELARAVEDVTGLEGYDPQVGEPVSDTADSDTPTRRHWPDDPDEDDDDDRAGRAGRTVPTATAVGDPRPDMAAETPDRPRRWWEFWRS